jgi:hypothetical protein
MDSAVVASSPTQQYGYVRCYRAVVSDCGVVAAYLYGVLEDYAQLGARTGKGCAPSDEHLGTLLGVHRNTIIGLRMKLREAGWITWDDTSKTNRYTLPNRTTTYHNPAQNPGTTTPPAQILGSTCTNSVQVTCTEFVHNQERDVSKNTLATTATRNGHHPSQLAAAVGEERFKRIATNFSDANPQLNLAWFRQTVTDLERATTPADVATWEGALRNTVATIQDAFGRDNTIKNPRAYVRSELKRELTAQEQVP